MLIGIPGDGVRPYFTGTFLPLCEALAAVAQPGDVLELATANLGLVVLDEGCAFSHTALTEDEWCRSACRGRDAERVGAESTS
jgi:hypothetical protein